MVPTFHRRLASLRLFSLVSLATGVALASACGDGVLGEDDRDAGTPDAALDDVTTLPAADSGASDASNGALDATILDAGPADGSGAEASLDAAGPGVDSGRGPEYAFVATYLDGVRVFSIDGQSGAPSEIDGSPFGVGAGVSAIAIDPTRRFAYVADTNAGAVDGYRIAPATGALTHLEGFPVAVAGAPLTISIHPSGRFAYVGDEKALYAFAIDAASGAFTPLAHSPFDAGGTVAYVGADPSGRFLYASQAGPPGIQAFTIDDAGAIDKIDGSPFGTASVHGGALAFHRSGRFVYNASGLLSGFAIDPASGALSPLAGTPVDGGRSDPMAVDLAIEPRGRFVYSVNNGNDALYAYAIDDAGALTALGGSPYDGGTFAYAVAVDPDGRFVYVGNDDADQMSVFSVDPDSGQLTPVTGSPFSPLGLQPEIVVTRLPTP
jgi:6-phosphogluconolactonase (cycloisomerase 2 family)